MGLYDNLTLSIIVFAAASAAVVYSAMQLARAGDVIAIRTGLGHLWVGLLLIAGATSLPELVTNLTAVLIDNPGLAAANILGANMLNISKLAVIASVLGAITLFQRLSPGQELLGIVTFILMTAVAIYVAMGAYLDFNVHLYGTTPAAVTIIAIYLIGSRKLYIASKAGGGDDDREEAPDKSLRWGWTVYGISAVFVCASAIALTVSADAIADSTGISANFVGVLAVATVTSLPELIVAATCIRIGAPELAVAGLYGSNSFNVAILAVADIAYVEGSLFEALGTEHVIAAGVGAVMMAMGLIQIRLRRSLKHFSLTEPSTALILGMYVVGLLWVYQAGQG